MSCVRCAVVGAGFHGPVSTEGVNDAAAAGVGRPGVHSGPAFGSKRKDSWHGAEVSLHPDCVFADSAQERNSVAFPDPLLAVSLRWPRFALLKAHSSSISVG